jgi:hypothetical protein
MNLLLIIKNSFRLSIFTGLLFAFNAYAQEAGSVTRSSGKVTITTASNQVKALAKGDAVNSGDTITTEDDSQVLIRLKDNSTMAIRPKSKIKIAEFKFEKQPTDTIKTNVMAGTLRAVSGQIGKGQPDNVKYEANTATIGIRGTDIELAIIPEGGKDRAGVYNYVHDGEVSMALSTGEKVTVTKELTGFTPDKLLPGESRLQVLRDRPAFLVSGGFDALINQLTAPRLPMR